LKYRAFLMAVVVATTPWVCGPTMATEPQVAFEVNDGWMSFSLTHDEKPVANAKVRVLDTRGGVFAEGEPGPEGRGEFPMPPSHYFLVEIKVAERIADPIMLTKRGNGVAPDSVLLSFGLRACCRVSPSSVGAGSSDQNSPPIPPWWPLVIGTSVLLCLTTAIVLRYRLPSPHDTNQQR
jgi:hypothetical protein